MTVNGAYQYFEENEKGTVTPGKKADFVILEQNPLETEADEIRNIRGLFLQGINAQHILSHNSNHKRYHCH